MDCWEEAAADQSSARVLDANPSHSRTVSPSLEDPSSSAVDTDEWHQETSDWDDVVLMTNSDDHECRLHFQDSPIGPRSIMLDSSFCSASADPVPSIDEFLVGNLSDTIELKLSDFEAPELPPPPPGSDEATEIPESPKDFHELYCTRLSNLKKSMKRSRESRKCLHAVSPQTKKYHRRKSISQVTLSSETSSRQIDQYLNPDFLKCDGDKKKSA